MVCGDHFIKHGKICCQGRLSHPAVQQFHEGKSAFAELREYDHMAAEYETRRSTKLPK